MYLNMVNSTQMIEYTELFVLFKDSFEMNTLLCKMRSVHLILVDFRVREITRFVVYNSNVLVSLSVSLYLLSIFFLLFKSLYVLLVPRMPTLFFECQSIVRSVLTICREFQVGPTRF